MQGRKLFLKTDEIVTEYDYEMKLLSQIRREGGKALISSYANSLTETSFQIAELNLEETLAAMVKQRYGKQQLAMSEVLQKEQEIREVQMTDLLIRLFYVFAVLTVISLFVCTLPVWLIVLVVVLLLR